MNNTYILLILGENVVQEGRGLPEKHAQTSHSELHYANWQKK